MITRAEIVEAMKAAQHHDVYFIPEMWGCDIEELDAAAVEAGWVGIWQTIVDAAGMRDMTEAVAPPGRVGRFRRRVLTNPSKTWILPARTLIKIHGIPYTTAEPVLVYGATDVAVALQPDFFKPATDEMTIKERQEFLNMLNDPNNIEGHT